VTAAYDVLSVLAGPLDEAIDAGEVVGVYQGRDRRIVLARIAEDVPVNGGVEAFEEGLADRLLDQDAGPGEADLPAVVVLARRPGGRGVEVGVLEDDEGALAPKLGGEGFVPPRPRSGAPWPEIP
jgi:hypothetical protein